MTDIDKHALCQLLAKWAGVEIHEYIVPGEIDQGFVDSYCWITQDEDGGIDDLWDPFTDANQVELAKAGLRRGRDDCFHYHYISQWHWDSKQHEVVVYKIWLTKLGCDQYCYRRFHESEAMALALAIQAMEEGH